MRCSIAFVLAIAQSIGSVYAVDAFQNAYNLAKRQDPITTELGPKLSSGAEIILPSDAGLFANQTARYSEYYPPGISAVVKVASETDVSATIKYANKKKRAFLAQNAGHGWATMNQTQNGILIKVDGLNSVSVDTNKNTVTVGGGVKVGDVIPSLYANKKETATGTCNCVGFMGATLGGGHGRMQGNYGLIADNLISARVALATGEIVTVSEESNSDLLWALRGAGHNFGIVTRATFKIYDQTNDGNNLNIDVVYSEDVLEAVFEATENNELPAEASVYIFFVGDSATLTPIVILNFVYAGPDADGNALFEKIYGSISSLSRTNSTLPWNELNAKGASNFFTLSCVGGGRKNTYTASLKTYNSADIRMVYDSYASFIKTNPGAVGTVFIFESYSLQGVQAIDSTATAYPHRDQRHIVLIGGGYTDASLDDVTSAWGKNIANILTSHSGNDKLTAYVNYAHGDEDFGAKYGYESWRQQALVSLKKKYDPSGVFDGFHPIPTSL